MLPNPVIETQTPPNNNLFFGTMTTAPSAFGSPGSLLFEPGNNPSLFDNAQIISFVWNSSQPQKEINY